MLSQTIDFFKNIVSSKISLEQKDLIENALASYKNAIFPQGLFCVTQHIDISKRNKCAHIHLVLPIPCISEHEAIKEHVINALPFPVKITINTQISPVFQHELKGIKNIIVVSSGKGGVGKSTTSVNLAYALQVEGAQVGILDADVYGPSIPKMFGLEKAHPRSPDGKHLEPVFHQGIASMSTGYLADGQDAKVWRGSLASAAFEQMLKETLWGDLDYLIIDMPPGTGDIQITLAQKIPAVVSVVVTTPQDMAFIDALKGMRMFEKVNIPVLGVIENMSMYTCEACDHTSAIFKGDSAQRLAQEKNTAILGQLPLAVSVRECADLGQSIQKSEGEEAIAHQYLELAKNVSSQLFYQYDSRSPTT